ncbi:hypothetical protein KI387_001874, partial [Taxus chinensis]
VCKSKHCLIDDEEHCTCTFKVLWQAGPNAYRITSISCENICLLTTGNIESHPVMKEFVNVLHYNLARREQELSLDLNSIPVELKTEQLHIPTSVDIRIEGSKQSENFSLSACGGMKRPSSSSVMDNWYEGLNFERASEQVTVEENQKDKEITEGNVGKNSFLHYSRGYFKRWMLRSNEIFTGGRQVQDYSQINANVKASETLVQHGNDLDGVDTLSSSYLTPSYLKHGRRDSTMEPFACSTYLQQGVLVQNLGNQEIFLKVVHDISQPVEQFLDIELQPQKIPIEVLGISSDKISHVFQMQSNSSSSIDVLRSSGLTTSDVKGKIQNNPYEGCKDPSYHLGQARNNLHIVKVVNKQNELKIREMRCPELPSEAVNISSDEEDDHGTSKKKCDYGSKDLSRQHGTHFQLQRELSTVEEIKVDGTHMSKCHRNVRSKNEDTTIFRCNHEGQKNISTIQHHCSGHSVSEKSNCYPSVYLNPANVPSFDSDSDLGKHFHLISNECQNTSPSFFQVYSRPSDSSIRHNFFPSCNRCGTFSVNSFTAHGKYFSQSSMHRCDELCISDVSAHLEDKSYCDGDGIGHSMVSNCKHCRKSMKSILSSNRGVLRIERGLIEDRCGHLDAGCGYCNEDVRTKELQFYSSEILVLDNLEKDVSPFDVKDAISSMGCSVLHVYILPTLKLEHFTRGFVWFQDRASLMKALSYLQDDNLFVTSSNGRPWVVLHIDGVFEGIFEGFNIEPKYSSSRISFVYKGTEDFEKAKKRKNIFLEFKEQLTLLHKRLEFEEKVPNES